MKIEIAEKEIRLIPENQWEIEALKTLQRRGVSNLEFQDSWESTGYLKLKQSSNDWGT